MRIRLLRRTLAMLCLASVVFSATSCDGTTEPSSEQYVTVQVHDQDEMPVVGARVAVHKAGEDAVHDGITAEDGGTEFNLLPGIYALDLTLPRGYQQDGATVAEIVVEENVSTIPVQVRATREAVVELTSGRPDTVNLTNGTRLSFVVPVELEGTRIRVSETEADSDSGIGGSGGVRIEINGGGAMAFGNDVAGMAADGGSLITINMSTLSALEDEATGAQLELGVSTTEGVIHLYAAGDATTVTTSTGQTRTELHYTLDVTADPLTLEAALVSTWGWTCDGPTDPSDVRYVRPVSASDTLDIPVLFIHGLQPKHVSCLQVDAFNPAPLWQNLISRLQSDPALSAAYSPYIVRYPSFARVLKTSEFLDDWLSEHHPGKDAVLVGHSMGGLVARGVTVLRASKGEDPGAHVVTLGTPHEGSPVAATYAAAEFIGPIFYPILLFLPDTDGVDDLRATSDLISAFTAEGSVGDPVYTFAGRVGPSMDSDYDVTTLTMLGDNDDGMVPVSSAAPDWTRIQRVYGDHDHTAMREAADVQNDVLDALRSLTTEECLPAPEPLAANDFSISGTVARHAAPHEDSVDAVLHPIVIDGEALTGLDASNFTIVEDGCARPFELTTEEGNVGLDLVFVQDLSGSMGGAIAGVQESVVSFADSLAALGIDVRFASIGFSGEASTIPSTPGPAPSEFVGPVQPFTDVSSFQDHVVNAWYASGGGDPPENGLEAIEYAHHNLAWRAGAVRAYVIITDTELHTANTVCDTGYDYAQCTDQTLESAATLVGTEATIHAVSPDWATTNQDAAELATLTGGTWIPFPSGGWVDLSATGLGETLAEIVRLTFRSASEGEAIHDLRIRAEVNKDGTPLRAELVPRLISYDILQLDPSLVRKR